MYTAFNWLRHVWPRSIYITSGVGMSRHGIHTRSKPMSFSEGLDCRLNVILTNQWFLHSYIYIFRKVVLKFKIDKTVEIRGGHCRVYIYRKMVWSPKCVQAPWHCAFQCVKNMGVDMYSKLFENYKIEQWGSFYVLGS